MLKIAPLTMLAVLTASGCATLADPSSRPNSPEPGPTAWATQPAPAADRQAILSMVGEFQVTFAFNETVTLSPAYERHPAKRSAADEVVIVVADDGDRIVLQHLLVVGDNQVIKHWRQDWTWQAGHRLEFSDDQTWRRVALAPDKTAGTWTQCVYEVVDSPRYCGTGRWNHRYGHATWTSDRTWRPLPRREYTTRDDYNALNVENRHTITPSGWTHEQDNSKVVRRNGRTERVIVREFGFNDYRRNADFDFSAAYAYWDRTSAYWARVRATWQRHFESGGVILNTAVDGMPVINGLFELAEQVENGASAESVDIDRVFLDYVTTPSRDALAAQR